MADVDLPVFALIGEVEQAQELRSFLKAHGAEGLSDTAPDSHSQNVLDLIRSCDVVGVRAPLEEVEPLLNSICSLIIVLPIDEAKEAVSLFCAQLTSAAFDGSGWQSKAGAAVRVLSNLFHGFSDVQRQMWRFDIYCALVRLCGRSGLIAELPTDLPTLRRWFADWRVDTEQRRDCLRELHAALTLSDQTDSSAMVMIELLATFTDADAAAALEDARECVRAAVVNPQLFVFDHLTSLRPVQLLETGDPAMHRLLHIFVGGSLSDFLHFADEQAEFVGERVHAPQDVLVRKMRLLTLMSLAEAQSELSFAVLSEKLHLKDELELEDFIIKAIRSNAIQAKIDQVNQRLMVSGTKLRRFEQPQWEQLRQRLQTWAANLRVAQQHLQSLSAETPAA